MSQAQLWNIQGTSNRNFSEKHKIQPKAIAWILPDGPGDAVQHSWYGKESTGGFVSSNFYLQNWSKVM